MVSKKRKEPGVLMGILACIPMLNWLALIITGLTYGAKFSLFCGIAYGIITYRFVDAAPFIWVIALFQYWIVYTGIICRSDRVEFVGEYEEEYEEEEYEEEYEDDKDVIDVEFSEVVVEEVKRIPQKKEVVHRIPQKKEETKKVELDFSQIDELRRQSDVVRTMLEVSQIQLLVDELSVEQKRVLEAILSGKCVWQKIERIAESQMSMPEIIIDEINEIAMRYLDDILIDVFETEVHILEQYANEIRRKMS